MFSSGELALMTFRDVAIPELCLIANTKYQSDTSGPLYATKLQRSLASNNCCIQVYGMLLGSSRVLFLINELCGIGSVHR